MTCVTDAGFGPGRQIDELGLPLSGRESEGSIGATVPPSDERADATVQRPNPTMSPDIAAGVRPTTEAGQQCDQRLQY
jgi:hypothetical protein